MKLKQWLCIYIGVIAGPVLLSIWQALEYTIHHLAVYRPLDVSATDLFKQHVGFNGHYAFYAIGSILGGASGALLSAWSRRNISCVRRVVLTGACLSFIVSCVTIFNWDFQSGVGYVGAPATPGLWAARIFYNATVKWSMAFIIAGYTAAHQLARK